MDKKCPECGGNSVGDYKFGGYWCSTCLAWFTTREYERKMNIKTTLKVERSPELEI